MTNCAHLIALLHARSVWQIVSCGGYVRVYVRMCVCVGVLLHRNSANYMGTTLVCAERHDLSRTPNYSSTPHCSVIP